jgi:hypothetical protein
MLQIGVSLGPSGSVDWSFYMKSFVHRFSAAFTALFLVAGMAGSVVAQQRNEKQVRDTIRNLSSQIDSFEYSLEDDMRRSSADSQDIDEASRNLDNLQQAITTFDDNFNARRENRDDVNNIVAAAQDVEGFFRRQPANQRVAQDWNSIKTNIDRLAGNYGVTPNWSGRVSAVPPRSSSTRSNYPPTANYPARNASVSNSGLTGTYRLDASKSENTDQILTETGVAGAQRQDLEKKLTAPAEVALDVRGNQVTLASSNASPVTLVADGRDKSDTDANGKTVRLRATLKGDELTISSIGGDTDYTIIFSPTDGDRSLKVTRRITTPYLQQTVFADSFYQRTDDVARLGIDTSVDNNAPTGGWSSSDNSQPNGNSSPTGPVLGPNRTGDFIVPNGTVVTAMLENTIDTNVSQNSDRFKMTVQSPLEFRGAVIEGHITGVGRSGRVSGRSNVTFNFDTITLRDGKMYDFAGFLQSIKDQNGKSVAVDTEGTAKGSSQTKETAKRGGVGAGLGAIIGAITGGGTGAVVGAIIGGSVGAGSVVVQGRDDLQLYKGSMITITSSSPVRADQPTDN